MRERSELILKIACGLLVGGLVFQLVRLGIHADPLRSVRIPELPTLTASPDAQTAANNTNLVSGKVAGTNATNSAAIQNPGEKATNATAAQAGEAGQAASTNNPNTITSQPTGEPTTNSAAAEATVKTETNSPAHPAGQWKTNSPPGQAAIATETNSSVQASTKTRTNVTPGLASEKNSTNAVSAHTPGKTAPQPFTAHAGITRMPELSPLIQARIDKIVQSELLAPFMRPMPMALLGIAGRDVFLRAPSGQTGLVKEGDELGGIKLLRIGINRVLVEQEGEKKELTIFSGLGSESLLPKPKPATNETTIKSK